MKQITVELEAAIRSRIRELDALHEEPQEDTEHEFIHGEVNGLNWVLEHAGCKPETR